MKFMIFLVILGLLAACNEKETKIIELEPPTIAVEEEVKEVVEIVEPKPIVEPKIIEEAAEVIEETKTVEIVEETPQVL